MLLVGASVVIAGVAGALYTRRMVREYREYVAFEEALEELGAELRQQGMITIGDQPCMQYEITGYFLN